MISGEDAGPHLLHWLLYHRMMSGCPTIRGLRITHSRDLLCVSVLRFKTPQRGLQGTSHQQYALAVESVVDGTPTGIGRAECGVRALPDACLNARQARPPSLPHAVAMSRSTHRSNMRDRRRQQYVSCERILTYLVIAKRSRFSRRSSLPTSTADTGFNHRNTSDILDRRCSGHVESCGDGVRRAPSCAHEAGRIYGTAGFQCFCRSIAGLIR
jgi:hypothetical protein